MKPGSFAVFASVAAAIVLMAGCALLPGAAQAPKVPLVPSPDTASAPSSTPAPADPSAGDDHPTSDSGDASCPADIVARICAEVNLTGATPVAGRGIVTAPIPPGSDPSTTCAAIAADHDGGHLGDHLDTVDGHQLAWDTTIADFRGPGTYAGSELHLTIDDDAYSATDGGKVAITIGEDFATTITMTNLLSSGNTPTRESGTITWTCVDPTTQ